mmetsp:Transcript_25984/g.33780  ORF Transcript_25984/g.33780 Transcript_25984/m.33780 type:complete len:456 (+) Transcript_25984:119-1486(+)
MGSSNSRHGLFRKGDYHKTVTIGKRRVKDGECCAIWDSSGNVRNVQGPKLEWIFMSDVRFLDRYTANQDQYLVASFADGRKQHVRGPASLFLDPVIHQSIHLKEAVSLNAFEAIVVYQEIDPKHRDNGIEVSAVDSTTIATAIKLQEDLSHSNNGRSVQRRVIRGPTLFIPSANEWVHEFSWHGPSNPNSIEDRILVKDKLKLTKIRTLPDQLYYNVYSCRTADDAQLCVKLMIFYQLDDLERMLDSTHDPIGDFANAVSADIIKFTSENTFEEFVKKSGELNDLQMFPVLLERAKMIGYRIDKIVFRGYQASSQLQAMHDAAIKGRTKLQLDTRTAEQEQFLENMKLNNKMDRSEKECEMNLIIKQNELNIKALEHKEFLKFKQEEIEQIQLKQIKEDQQKLAFLTSLANQGVDLTKYLCAKERKNEKTICIESSNSLSGGDQPIPHIHLQHDN